MKFEKVNFIVLGAPKCGTTSLYEILQKHPEIGCSNTKEPDFFSQTPNWKDHVGDYHSFFDQNADKKVFLECSTTYSFFPHWNLNIWDDIYAYNPHMKFLYIIRNPIDRTRSQYIHWLERGFTKKNFSEAIFDCPEILYTSMYHLQINPFIKKFGKENVLILKFEDFVHHRKKFLTELGNFIGVDVDLFQDYREVHANKSLTGEKRSHKFDRIRKNLKWVKKILPSSLVNSIWKSVTPKPSIQNRVHLSTNDKELILRALGPDLDKLSQIMNEDLHEYYGLK